MHAHAGGWGPEGRGQGAPKPGRPGCIATSQGRTFLPSRSFRITSIMAPCCSAAAAQLLMPMGGEGCCRSNAALPYYKGAAATAGAGSGGSIAASNRPGCGSHNGDAPAGHGHTSTIRRAAPQMPLHVAQLHRCVCVLVLHAARPGIHAGCTHCLAGNPHHELTCAYCA